MALTMADNSSRAACASDPPDAIGWASQASKRCLASVSSNDPDCRRFFTFEARPPGLSCLVFNKMSSTAIIQEWLGRRATPWQARRLRVPSSWLAGWLAEPASEIHQPNNATTNPTQPPNNTVLSTVTRIPWRPSHADEAAMTLERRYIQR